MSDVLARGKLARVACGLNAASLILMTDDMRLPDPVTAAMALPPGSLVIVRARDAARRASLALALRKLAWRKGLILLIADDPLLARTLGANGLHLPEAKARDAAHWRAQNSHWLITAAAHSLAGVLRAAHADAVLLSPVFASQSHKDRPALGAARARLIARAAPKPVFALGGISAGNAGLLSGFAGIAAINALA